MTPLLRDTKTMRNLVGEKIGNLNVETCLSNGPFAQVYKTKNTATGLTSAFKVAQSNSVTTSSRPTPDQSQALEEITGAVMQVRPDPRALLHYQVSFTQSIGNEVFPRIFSFIEETDRQLVGYEMEFIDGVTLQDLIAKNAATILHVELIAAALEKLLSCAPYHGDLKPSNIIIHESTVKLLDPGFFGEIKSALGDSFPMKVTTPLYYPYLKPDDFFAIGLIAWEVVLGRHPLKYTEFADADISEQLDLVVRTQEIGGQFFLSPLRKLPIPVHLIPQLDPAAQKILLKLLRLSVTDEEKLEVDPGYQSISEIVTALKELKHLLKTDF